MAVTKDTYTAASGSLNGPYGYSFPIIDAADIRVTVNGLLKTVTTHYTVDAANTDINFVSGQGPSTGDQVIVYRDTDEDPITATFVAGSTIRSNELNDNFKQLLYIAQESDNQSLSTLGGTMTGNLEIGKDQVIKFEGATANANETTLTVVDPTADRTITLPNVTGTVVTTGDTGTVTATMLAANSVDSSELVDGSIDTSHIGNLQVTTAKLANDCVTDGKIADDSINSWHYVDGSIDTAHIADAQVTAVKLADNAVTTTKITNANVTTAKLADNAVTTAKITNANVTRDKIADDAINAAKIAAGGVDEAAIADGNVTRVKIAADAIDQTKIADNSIASEHIANNAVGNSEIADDSIDSEHYVDGSIDTAHIADAQITEAKLGANAVTTAKINGSAVTEAKLATNSVSTTRIVNDAVNSDKIADNAVGASHIAANAVNGTHISDDVVDSEHYVAGSIDTEHIGDNQVTTAKIPDNAITTAKIADAELSTLAGMQSGTASILASGTALTSTTAELNLLDGKSVVTAVSGSSNDNQLPTAKAVNDQILALTQAQGGFYPIANEVSFPNANPDPGDDAGTIVSIADAGGIVVNGSGVSTTGRTLGGATVTINGIASSLHNSTIAAGKGMQVQTTSTLNTYTYHRLLVDEAGVATAQTLVSDFNERYRVGSSNPTSSKDDGDLFFNTSSNKMLVYNATDSSWDEVQSVGNFFIATFSESFNGTRTAFTVSNAPTSAQQIIISINGVIQKPNAGTGQPSEGFTLSSSTVTFSSAPPSGSDYFAVVLGSAVNIGTPSNNTVTTAILQNGAVTLDKMASESVDEDNLKISNAGSNGQFLQKQSGNTGGLTWASVTTDLVGDTTPQLGGNLDTNGFNISLDDQRKLKLGTGEEYEIYNDNVNLIIDQLQDGSTTYFGHKRGGQSIFYASDTGNQVAAKFKFSNDSTPVSSAELYYGGAKKFETTTSGTTSYGNLDIDTGNLVIKHDKKITIGVGYDLQIEHDGSHSNVTNSTGNLHVRCAGGAYIQNEAGTENRIKTYENGSVDLFFDNSRKFETTASGVSIAGGADGTISELRLAEGNAVSKIATIKGISSNTNEKGIEFKTYSFAAKTPLTLTHDGHLNVPDSSKIQVGSGQDLQIYHNGSHSYIWNTTGDLQIRSNSLNMFSVSGEQYFQGTSNGATELYYDNSKKFETRSDGAEVFGDLRFGDNKDANFGNSADLKIYHNGSNSVIENLTGALVVKPEGLMRIQDLSSNEVRADFNNNSSVDLYYDGVKTFETFTNGIIVRGPENSHGIIDLYADEGDDNDDKWRLVANTNSNFYLQHWATSIGWFSTLAVENEGTVTITGREDEGAILKLDADEGDDNNDKWRMISQNHGGGLEFQSYEDGAWEKRLHVGCGDNGSIQMAWSNQSDITQGGISLANANMASKFYATGNSTANVILFYNPGNGNVGKIQTVNTQTNFVTSSDYRLKENNVPLENAITKLKALKPYTFNFKKQPSIKVDGFYAHEADTVVPQAVTGDKDAMTEDEKGATVIDPQGVDYGMFTPLLTKALQEAIAKIETLETKVAALEAK